MNMEIGAEMSAPAHARGRRTVGTYSRYADAQRAVDYLSDRKFPVEHVAIVAEGLRIVEQVTGRLTYGRVGLNGALSGAILGGLFAFLFGLFNWLAPVVSALEVTLYGMLYGAILGSLLNMLFYAFTGGERDFSSVGGIDAERYNVNVDEEVADEAARLLASRGELPRPRTPSAGGLPQPA